MISKFKITNIINQASIDRIKSIDNSSHFSVQKFMGNDTYLLEGVFILWNVENSTHHIALKFHFESNEITFRIFNAFDAIFNNINKNTTDK